VYTTFDTQTTLTYAALRQADLRSTFPRRSRTIRLSAPRRPRHASPAPVTLSAA
jgi:hypothetical protein